MKIAFISSEIFPFAKTGGLADVSFALPQALARRGHNVIAIMPGYLAVDKDKYNLELLHPGFAVPFFLNEKLTAIFASCCNDPVKTFFIEYGQYFGRDGLYNDGYIEFNDNAERYAFFSRASLELLKKINFTPDIIHCNDWQTGVVPVYLKTIYSNEKLFKTTAVVFTVHNAGYQGKFHKDKTAITGLDKKGVDPAQIESEGQLNYLKAGILYSDIINTVSRRYADEIQTPEFGHNLAPVFRERTGSMYGILNGIDAARWDPSRDIHLNAKYSRDNPEGKALCKAALQGRFGLAEDETIPLAGIISRLTYQKGMDVLAEALEYLMQDERFQFILVGDGDESIHKKFMTIKEMFPYRIGLYHGYTEELAHSVQAGLDIFIMPSRYEPCGLSVMYSLRYGTVPIVRATGGLYDIIDEWDDVTGHGNGFLFHGLTVDEIYPVVRKVIRKFKNKSEWEKIIRNAMSFNHTWDDAVTGYENIYNIALEEKF